MRGGENKCVAMVLCSPIYIFKQLKMCFGGFFFFFKCLPPQQRAERLNKNDIMCPVCAQPCSDHQSVFSTRWPECGHFVKGPIYWMYGTENYVVLQNYFHNPHLTCGKVFLYLCLGWTEQKLEPSSYYMNITLVWIAWYWFYPMPTADWLSSWFYKNQY